MRIWFKMFADARLVKSETVEDFSEESRTHKIFAAVEKVCYSFDLGKPNWLDSNVKEFQRRAVTRITQDNFEEEIEFDFLEIHVLEED